MTRPWEKAYSETIGRNVNRKFAGWFTPVRRKGRSKQVEDFFDVESLARYLHLSPDQVRKMAERDRLPGQKVGGEWRFNRQEIFHWFEQRIGISGEVELQQYEQLLTRHEFTPLSITIEQLLPPELIWLNCPSRTRNSLIRDVCDFAVQQGFLWDSAKMATAIQNREQLNSTALDNGVAMLHPRRPQNDLFMDPFLALAICPSGIPFGGPRGTMTDIFFLIASDSDSFHLKVLTRLSRIIQHENVLLELRQVDTAIQARDLLIQADQTLN